MSNTVQYAKNNGIEIVIPPKSNRKLKSNFDNYLYFYCHIIENAFLAFKLWCNIDTRYFKTFIALISSLFIPFYLHLYFFSILNLSTLSYAI